MPWQLNFPSYLNISVLKADEHKKSFIPSCCNRKLTRTQSPIIQRPFIWHSHQRYTVIDAYTTTNRRYYKTAMDGLANSTTLCGPFSVVRTIEQICLIRNILTIIRSTSRSHPRNKPNQKPHFSVVGQANRRNRAIATASVPIRKKYVKTDLHHPQTRRNPRRQQHSIRLVRHAEHRSTQHHPRSNALLLPDARSLQYRRLRVVLRELFRRAQ